MRAVDRDEVGGRPCAGDDQQDRRRRPAVEHLLQVDHLGRLCHLAGRVAGERLADEVGVVEGLVDLADGEDLEAANEVHQAVDVPLEV